MVHLKAEEVQEDNGNVTFTLLATHKNAIFMYKNKFINQKVNIS